LKYGLLIQGPRYSLGNGPNRSRSECGFDSLETVRENVRRMNDKVEIIILSTWHKSGFESVNIGPKVTLLESYPPLGFDYLNQKKQFLSMFVGASYISCNSDCTHIIKIRTDQLFPMDFIDWLNRYFTTETNDTKKIICSEFLRDQPFYAGDFVFAGTIEKIICFAMHVLQYDGQRLILNNSVDYVLKHLVNSDERIAKAFYECGLLRNQWKFLFWHRKIFSLWRDVSTEHFSVLPEEIFWQIIWRGRPMSEVFANNQQAFMLYKEWQMLNRKVDARELIGIVRFNFFILFKRAYIEFKRYVKARLKFCLQGN